MKNKFSVGSSAPLVKVTKRTLPVVVRELKRIEKDNGVITPAIVVDSARSIRSPLHKCFEWNDDAAAVKYREWQARILIGCVKVSFKDEAGEDQIVRAFVNVSPVEVDDEDDAIGEGGYISVERASRNVGYKKQVVQYAYGQLTRWKQKFGAFKEFFVVTEAIGKVKV